MKKDPFTRFCEATGCRTQKDLARFLDICQASISITKRRQNIPATWLLKALREKYVNPEWVLTGTGAQFMVPKEYIPGEYSADASAKHRQLEEYSSQELFTELVRRANVSIS